MWGIIPAAGRGSRIQPLAFSKELLPVGSRQEGDAERPLAVSEHLIERMLLAGVDKLCIVISPGKSDILEYYGGSIGGAEICYVVQERPAGLCDALFRAVPFIAESETVCVGLPDTIWFPSDGLARLGPEELSFLLFPVEQPQLFDAVDFAPEATAEQLHNVREIEVKASAPRSHWVWGAFKVSGRVLRQLQELWRRPGRKDEYWGTLINAYLAQGGRAWAAPIGAAYVDVGTLHGLRAASRLLESNGGADVPWGHADRRGISSAELLRREASARVPRIGLRVG
jgi:glucose-1-phosphate thymidylyltransferase